VMGVMPVRIADEMVVLAGVTLPELAVNSGKKVWLLNVTSNTVADTDVTVTAPAASTPAAFRPASMFAAVVLPVPLAVIAAVVTEVPFGRTAVKVNVPPVGVALNVSRCTSLVIAILGTLAPASAPVNWIMIT